MASAPVATAPEPTLNHARHKTYWLRCLRTYLPRPYTSNDNTRLTLAFFTVAALDLLGCLESSTKPEEREEYAKWIYHCQHPEGGFRGSPATDLGEKRTAENAAWDPANLPATFFALAALAILGDDFSRVKRRQCLEWLVKLQRPEGTFGETLGENGRVEGGTDCRFAYCAAGVRWMLRGNVEGEIDGVPDIKIDPFVECVRASETYDGGISEAPFHEVHAGFTYCAISALSSLSRLPDMDHPTSDPSSKPLTGLTNPELTLHWLVSRQTTLMEEEDAFEFNDDESDVSPPTENPSASVAMEDYQNPRTSSINPVGLECIGHNGRCNKVADTCYVWWVMGSLDVLGKAHLSSTAANRRYLLDKTQHIIGGFGKQPGDPPDIYHSYLGLAALSVLGEESLRPINSVLCFSQAAASHIESLPWRQGVLQKKPGSLSDTIYVNTDTPVGPVGQVEKGFNYLSVTGG